MGFELLVCLQWYGMGMYFGVCYFWCDSFGCVGIDCVWIENQCGFVIDVDFDCLNFWLEFWFVMG